MSSTSKRRFGFLPPFCQCDRDKFENNLVQRFTVAGIVAENIVEYADGVLDRQINKANGLIAFDGLLFTALSVVGAGAGSVPTSVKIGSVLSLVAALPLVLLLVVSFGTIDDYASPTSDFKAKCRVIYWRTYTICFSVLFSVAAAITSLWHLRWFWL